jgi:TRAP-type C4-dicarboxylate transport system substrate-binding protein
VRLLVAALFAILAAFAAAGCGAGNPPSRSGADVEPVTLTATSYEQQGRIAAETLAEFARRASALSNGAVKIKLGPEPDNSRPDTSADKIAEIRRGTYDLGIVAARSFDKLGVPSFQALQAPFLVTSNALGDRILEDGIAEEMLGTLDDLSLEGLALTYADRRFPLGYAAPLVSTSDYRGKSVAARPSAATYAMLRALGAVPTPLNGGELAAAAEAGTVVGSEGVLATNSPVSVATVTANTPWYFKANALVARRSVFDGLSGGQQDVLRQAAEETRTWAAGQHADDATAVRRYCADGHGAVVLATEAQLTALRAAVEPVYAEMERDPLTKKAIARISELAGETPPPKLAPCTPPSSAGPSVALAAKGDQSVLDGTWRLSVAPRDLEAAGATAEYVGGNAGVWTFHLNGGQGTIDQPRGDPCLVAYRINGKRIIFVFDAQPASGCGGALHGTFELAGDTGTFHWTKQDECCDPVAWDNAFWKNGLHRIAPP